MLGSFQCQASLAYLDISRTKACCTSGVVRIFFFWCLSLLSSFSHSPGDDPVYTEICFKELLNYKQPTN